MIAFRSRPRRRRGDDEGSIPMVMLIILLSTSLSALLIPNFITQSNATTHDSVRMHALNAAETGLQVALGRVRSAINPVTGAGSTALLPCGSNVTGQVTSSVNDNSQYTVSMTYYDGDPRGQSAAWLSANTINCANLLSTTPSYVTFSSVGTNNAAYGSPGDRTLTATYVVRTNNQNIPGGLIQNFYDGASTYLNLCMDAGSSSPAAGTVLTAQTCSYSVPDQQKFSYRNNLTIVLNATVTTTSAGMCLQASSAALITLQPCISSGASLYTQQWSFNDSAQFQSSTSTGGLGGNCIDIQTLDLAGSNVILGGCGGYPQRQGNWLPSPAAGAGMAGPNTNQLIDFQQFGRCLDLANFVLTDPLIAWPCKQTPNGTPGWNQRWTFNSTTGTLSTDAGPSAYAGNVTTPYCAQAPSANATGPALRVYVTPCPDPSGATPANLVWTSHLGASSSYHDRYTYTDFTGTRCLEPSATDFYSYSSSTNNANNTSYVVVAPCDGSLLQKWNGDPYVLLATPLRDANEH
jgi:hypothetical protein